MAELTFRDAVAADLPEIVALLADDPLGQTREDASLPLAQGYLEAFAAIDAAPDQRLVVACEGVRVVGTLQLLFLPGLSRKGACRGQIEAVRVARDRRGVGDRRAHGALGDRAVPRPRLRRRPARFGQFAGRRAPVLGAAGLPPSHRGFKLLL